MDPQVRAVLGRFPASVTDLFDKHGITSARFASMSADDIAGIGITDVTLQERIVDMIFVFRAAQPPPQAAMTGGFGEARDLMIESLKKCIQKTQVVTERLQQFSTELNLKREALKRESDDVMDMITNKFDEQRAILQKMEEECKAQAKEVEQNNTMAINSAEGVSRDVLNKAKGLNSEIRTLLDGDNSKNLNYNNGVRIEKDVQDLMQSNPKISPRDIVHVSLLTEAVQGKKVAPVQLKLSGTENLVIPNLDTSRQVETYVTSSPQQQRLFTTTTTSVTVSASPVPAGTGAADPVTPPRSSTSPQNGRNTSSTELVKGNLVIYKPDETQKPVSGTIVSVPCSITPLHGVLLKRKLPYEIPRETVEEYARLSAELGLDDTYRLSDLIFCPKSHLVQYA